MKVFAALALATIVGVAAGFGIAVLRINHAPWDGNPAGSGGDPRMPPLGRAGEPTPKLRLDQSDYDFGAMDFDAQGRHDFVVENVGDAPLVLTAGDTSCRCTLSRIEKEQIAPGQSSKVTLTWSGQQSPGPYRQSATIFSNDPTQPRVVLTVSGRLMTIVHADPHELVFSAVSVNEGASGQVRLYCAAAQPLEIVNYAFSDPEFANYFSATFEPLSPEQVAEDKDAHSGVLMKVAVKPGLPHGTFQQTILLQTKLDAVPVIEVPIQGTVGADITIVGPGWDTESGVLNFGTVNSQTGAQRRLMLILRGRYRKTVKFQSVTTDCEGLKATLGETTEINNGAVTQTPLIVEIPKGARPVNHLGTEQGKHGQIMIETTHPQSPKLRILVRFAVLG